MRGPLFFSLCYGGRYDQRALRLPFGNLRIVFYQLVLIVAEVSRLRARPKGFAVALWKPSPPPYRQVGSPTTSSLHPSMAAIVCPHPDWSCGASVTRRSAQVCSPRKGSPEGSKTPLVRESRGADGPAGGVQGQSPWSPQANRGAGADPLPHPGFLMVKLIRFFFSSTSSTQTVTMSPTRTHSLGWVMRRPNWLMWMRPSR